jgi:hypothetical protein
MTTTTTEDNMALKIDIKTKGDDIEICERGTDRVIANLFAGQADYVVDQPAEDFSAAIMGRPARNLAAELAAIVSPRDCRMIAAMPDLE